MSDLTDTAPSRRAPELGAFGSGWDAAPPIGRMLEEHLCGLEPTSIVETQTIKKGVHRLKIRVGDITRSVIIKRLAPEVAYRNQALVTRWLPAVGLEEAGPILLGSLADEDGRRVWQIYEDLGETSLDSRPVDPALVEESVRLIAMLHNQFANHPLLGECRLWGGDLGIPFYHSNAVDAIRALRAIDPDPLRSEHRAALYSLLDTLRLMLDEEERRALLHVEYGGPETLLHGDLWRQNILLCSTDGGVLRPRLIDWDHVGVGQIGYDLSTLLGRFPWSEREGVMEIYRREISMTGWRLPSDAVLDQLFDTAERARIANRVIWPAIEIVHGDHVEWALDHLVELTQWFDRLEPLLT